MNEYPNQLKNTLTSIIRQMSEKPGAFVKNPLTDFTRTRKLPFESVIQLLISMGGNSIYKELLESAGYDMNTATTSAFIQQRDKILPDAFLFLLREFVGSFRNIKTFRGYRLLAYDGSDLPIPADRHDPDTYFQNHPGEKGYGLLHLNALYDLCNKIYIDACTQAKRCEYEQRALTDMVDHSPICDKAILIADRGLECYNVFAHIEKKGWHYLIRAKDLGSSGIASGLALPKDGEFDIPIRRLLTRRQTNEIKARPDIYKFMPKTQEFDFLVPRSHDCYTMCFRVVRLKIAENSYEILITNLPQSEFSSADLKELYRMRWGIETSFRALKYTIGLINFHAKKRERILQETFARMILYNFAEMITSHVIISQASMEYTYQVNFTVAVHVCRQFLRLSDHAPPLHVEALIRKNILPIRPGRKGTRKIRHKSAVSFLYRVA